MYLSWRERLKQEPRLQDYKNWPFVPVDHLPKKKRKRFIRNQRLIASVLSGESLSSAAKNNHVSVSKVSRLLSRCLSGEDTNSPPLTSGIIPSKHTQAHQRTQTIPALINSNGTPCAFSALLRDVPHLKTKLDEYIKAKFDDKPYAQNLKPQWFHGEFKRILKEENWPQDHYPYTTSSVAYESVRKYLHQRQAELLAEKQLSKQQPTRITQTRTPFHRALKRIQIDEHHVDSHSNVHLVLNDELIPLRLSRINAIVAVDVETDCHLGFAVAYTQHPNQQDMLTLLDNMVCPQPLLPLTTPGFKYVIGAEFPVNVIDEHPITFGHVQLDNALMHLANSVRDAIEDQQSGSIGLGLGGVPKTRNWIEAAFDYINRHANHRFTATTGSHVKDPIRESKKNAKRIPTVSLRTLEEAMSIVITQHNVTPQAQLGGATPLALFQKHCREHYVRYIPELLRKLWLPFMGRQTLPIKWLKHENRMPHVNFYGVRYPAPCLLNIVTHEKEIVVEYDRRDIRQLKAFSKNGKELGIIYASRSWQRFPHSLATRQYINKLIKNHRLAAEDPLAGYFRWLLDQKGKPKIALQLVKVYQEFTQDHPESLILNGVMPKDESMLVNTTNKENKFSWNMNNANHEE